MRNGDGGHDINESVIDNNNIDRDALYIRESFEDLEHDHRSLWKGNIWSAASERAESVFSKYTC